jgi:hypothetical protein
MQTNAVTANANMANQIRNGPISFMLFLYRIRGEAGGFVLIPRRFKVSEGVAQNSRFASKGLFSRTFDVTHGFHCFVRHLPSAPPRMQVSTQAGPLQKPHLKMADDRWFST